MRYLFRPKIETVNKNKESDLESLLLLPILSTSPEFPFAHFSLDYAIPELTRCKLDDTTRPSVVALLKVTLTFRDSQCRTLASLSIFDSLPRRDSMKWATMRPRNCRIRNRTFPWAFWTIRGTNEISKMRLIANGVIESSIPLTKRP